MRKGFTLIELLGVIVVLGIIGLITIPIISSVISDSKETIDEDQKATIIQAAKNWASENTFDLPSSGNCTLKKVSDLISSGYLRDTSEYPDACVTIKNEGTSTNAKYTYTYNENCSATC